MSGVKSAFIPYEFKRDLIKRTKARVKDQIAEFARALAGKADA